MNAAELGQNMGIKLKNFSQNIQKQVFYLIVKHTKQDLRINVGLIINFLSITRQNKRKVVSR